MDLKIIMLSKINQTLKKTNTVYFLSCVEPRFKYVWVCECVCVWVWVLVKLEKGRWEREGILKKVGEEMLNRTHDMKAQGGVWGKEGDQKEGMGRWGITKSK